MNGSLPPSSITVGFDLAPTSGGARLAGRFAAGQRGGLDPWITKDGLDSLRRHQQRLEAILGKAAAGDHVGQIQRRLRHVGGVLEQADVAGHQRGRGEPDGLPQREVPRHHGQHHAERLPPGVGALRADLRRLGRLVGKQLLGVLGVVAKALGALDRFALGRLQSLAHFKRHHGADLVGFLLEQVGGGVGPFGPLGEGGGTVVVEEALVGAGDGSVDFAVSSGGESFDCLAGGRVDGRD
jgi:hypothetical protein